VEAYEAGKLAAAAEHFAGTLRAEPEHVRAHTYAGGIDLRTGRFREALEHFERARMLDPQNAECHFGAAVAHRSWARTRRRANAAKQRSRSTRLHPHIGFLASLNFPGPLYLKIIAMLHSHLRPRTYLEIGVETGQSIALARRERARSVSTPNPRSQSGSLLARAYMPHERRVLRRSRRASGVRRLAYRSRFHRRDAPIRIRAARLHEYREAQHATVNDIDSRLLPLSRHTAERERRTTFWSGDIWRLILILRKYRPDLSVKVIGTAPTAWAWCAISTRFERPPAELRCDRRGVSGARLFGARTPTSRECWPSIPTTGRR